MFLLKLKWGVVVLFLALIFSNASALHPNAPTSTAEAVIRIADRLVDTQIKTGVYAGAWPAVGGVPAGTFTGTIAAGLADAYWMTCDDNYKNAAVAAGNWIWDHAVGCALYYDEAYAFMKLSQIACDPASNQWRTALVDFYSCVEGQPPDANYGNKAGTELFVAQIEEALTPPFATFEVAYYTVAAYYVDTPQKAIWREELIRLLISANVSSGEQIYTLGAATWALAQTGAMDATELDPYVGSTSWTGFPGGAADYLYELAPLLASYQLPSSYPIYRDHFYSLYLPPNPGFSGWTETNIYAVMGLDAVDEVDPDLNYRTQIDRTWAVNMQPVDAWGDVWYNAVSNPFEGDNAAYYHYAGEYLQYLAAARLPGDIDMDDSVELDDVMTLAINWLGITGCNCSIADLTQDRKVDLHDLARLSQGWLLSR